MDLTGALVLVIIFVILLLLRVPIAFSIGISTLATILVSVESLAALTTVAQRMTTGLDSFTLLAIPFFILAGQIMNRGGIAQRLINLAKVLVGMLPGGLAYVNIISAMLFGAISGSAVAAASAIGGVMTPQMDKEGYDREYSAAVNITSSTMGLLIPPSNVLIVYSLASGGLSIAALFLAGYLPGILVGLGLMVVGGVIAIRRKYKTGERVPLKEAALRFLDAIPSLFLIILVIGGIIAGIFTATEAAAIAVLYAFILAFAYKEMKIADISQVLFESAKTTAIVMLLIGTSIAMSWILSYENIPQALTAAIIESFDSPIAVLLIINLILLFVGAFMDITPAILIFTPIFLPIAIELGIDPIHFGIIMVFNLIVGLCTPPVGTILFVGCSVAEVPITKVIRPLLPLFAVMIVCLALVTFIPEISLFLPEFFGY
ncbi:MAG: TRAP transporter large permease [Bacteroidota bacterium]